MSKRYEHSFTAPVAERYMGTNARGELIYRVVYLPQSLCDKLGVGAKDRMRIVGELEGEAIRLALNPDKQATHFLMVSKSLLRKVNRDVGDEVQVSFNVEADDFVDVPDILERALDGDPEAHAEWLELTPGKQRIWTTLVEHAKRPETRERRVTEVIGRLKAGQLDPRKKWQGS